MKRTTTRCLLAVHVETLNYTARLIYKMRLISLACCIAESTDCLDAVCVLSFCTLLRCWATANTECLIFQGWFSRHLFLRYYPGGTSTSKRVNNFCTFRLLNNFEVISSKVGLKIILKERLESGSGHSPPRVFSWF